MAEFKNPFEGAASGARGLFSILPYADKYLPKSGERPKDLFGQVLYDFGEGAAPSAAFGAIGGLPGALVAGGIGGLTNAVAKQTTDNPWGQLAINLTPAAMASLPKAVQKVLAARMPKMAASQLESGVVATPGQVRNNPNILHQEDIVLGQGTGAMQTAERAVKNTDAAKQFADTIQNIDKASKGMSATAIRDATSKAVDEYTTRAENLFKATNKLNFGRAKRLLGDAEVFDSTPLVEQLKIIASKYADPAMPANLQAVSAKATKMLEALVTPDTPAVTKVLKADPLLGRMQDIVTEISPAVPGAPKKITLETLQKNLEMWGKEAYGKSGGVFSDVAQGSVKGEAKQVLSGLYDVIGEAANSTGIAQKGAQQLIKARDSFKTGLEKLDDISQIPFIKKFSVNPNSMTGEDAVKWLNSADPSERPLIAAILSKKNPEALQAAKADMWGKYVSAFDGNFSAMSKSIGSIFGKQGQQAKNGISDLDWMFPSKQEQSKLKVLMDDLDVLGRGTVGKDTSLTDVVKAGLPAAAAVVPGGGYTARTAVGLAERIYDFIKHNPKEMLKALDDPNYFKALRSKDPSKILPFFNTVAEGNKGNVISNVGRLINPEEKQPNTPQEEQFIPPTEADFVMPTEEDLQATPEGDFVMPSEEDVKKVSSFDPKDIEAQIRAEAQRQGLGQHADLFVKQAMQESGLNPYATSKKGAGGVFQLMPDTATELGVTDPYDIQQNIAGGITYMGQQLKRFGNVPMALAAYNAGPQRVIDSRGIPNIPETQQYVRSIYGM